MPASKKTSSPRPPQKPSKVPTKASALAKLSAAGIAEVDVWKAFEVVYGLGGSDAVVAEGTTASKPPLEKARQHFREIAANAQGLDSLLPTGSRGRMVGAIHREASAAIAKLERHYFIDATESILSLPLGASDEEMLFRRLVDTVKEKTGTRFSSMDYAALLLEEKAPRRWWLRECKPAQDEAGNKEQDEARLKRLAEAVRKRVSRRRKHDEQLGYDVTFGLEPEMAELVRKKLLPSCKSKMAVAGKHSKKAKRMNKTPSRS